MATYVHRVHTVTLPNESLRKVTLSSEQDRAASIAAYYGIRVGIARGDDTDYIAEYDGAADSLTAREPVDLTGSSNVDVLLQEDDALVVEVTKNGTPSQSLTGLTVEIQMNLVGGDSERPGALFAAAGMVVDTRTRAAVDGLVSQLNRSGVQSWTVAVPLIDPDTAPAIDASDSYTAVKQDVAAGGALENGTVSVTVTLPAGRTTGYAKVTAQANVLADSGAGSAFMAIGDGTTDHNEHGVSTPAGVGQNVTSSISVEVAATTTFRTRHRAETGSVDVNRQSIAVLCIWT